MKLNNKLFTKNIFANQALLLIFIYFLFNVLFLDKFPFIHSDESWLGGLSRNYLSLGTPNTTESFFNIYPRFPHAIKIIFHYLQGIFIFIFGYTPFVVRLVSLVFSCLTLYIFFLICTKSNFENSFSIITLLLLAFDIQFIYASHFGRQEIIILFLIILSFYIYINKYTNIKKSIILAIITGIGIGIHPNSIIIASVIGVMYLYDIITGREKLSNIVYYIAATGLFALIYIFISYNFDTDFISNYMKFGDQFGVLNDAATKSSQFLNFYLKLFYGVSGTYYTPNIKFQLLLFLFTFIFGLLFIYKNRNDDYFVKIVLAVIAININYIIIGRYNQTSIIFIFPFIWLMFSYLINKTNIKRIISLSIMVIIFIISIFEIYPYLNNDYDDYLKNISKTVSSDSIVLANLNSEFYFNNGKLLDYRNLSYLKEANMNFSNYIAQNKIEYIIFPEEMDFIYGRRPVWNGIYGNLYYYYDDMINFLEDECTLIDSFNSSYAMRIVRYANNKDWNVNIYKVNK